MGKKQRQMALKKCSLPKGALGLLYNSHLSPQVFRTLIVFILLSIDGQRVV